MTTIFRSTKTCGCCGKENQVLVIGSTFTVGSSDLDMRPPEGQRSAMYRAMQFCRRCGYTAWDLEEEMPPSEALKEILSEKIGTYHGLFERAARIAELKGKEKAEVRRLYLAAAWAADDRKYAAEATALRKKTLARVSPEEELTPENLLQLVDVARRAGEKETAAALLERFAKCKAKPLLKRVARFQKKLLDADDTACYTFDDVPQKR